MKKDELASFYEDISEIGREYGAEIDEPVKTTQYEYIRSSLKTLANISERFKEHPNDFYAKREQNLRDLAVDISRVNQKLRDTHTTEAALLLYGLADQIDLDTDVTEEDFTPIGMRTKKSLKRLVDTHLED